MATYAFGDIHGCRTALDLLLDQLRLGRDDLAITLGDYVDRGPDSRGVLDRLIQLRAEVTLIALRGNHEIMMGEARFDPDAADYWRAVGGAETLASYGEGAGLDDVPAAHWAFIEQLVPYHETERDIFVHAGCSPNLPMARQSPLDLYWEKLGPTGWRHASGKRVICGHSRQMDGLPRVFAGAVCIDTSAYDGLFLTVLEVETGRYWQASEAGERRVGSLAPGRPRGSR